MTNLFYPDKNIHMTKTEKPSQSYTLFRNNTLVANGDMADIKASILAVNERFPEGTYLCFNDLTGEYVDVDFHTEKSTKPLKKQTELKRGRPSFLKAPRAKTKKAGRPSLGVVAREVTLLPRHWKWLNSQSSSASSALRELIDETIRTGRNPLEARNAMARADKFMSTALGDQPGYEEASRALYRADKETFYKLIEAWPNDLKNYVKQLSNPAFDAG